METCFRGRFVLTKPNTPCLIPVRVMACVFDPQTLSRTTDVLTERGTVRTSPHAWAWHAPNYEKLDSNRTEAFERVWPQLFESVEPPAMKTRGGVCLTITPPSGFSRPVDDDESHVLPYLPDRWLWVRIVRRMYDTNGQPMKDKSPSVRTWIIDSGITTENPESAPILTGIDGKITACRVGVRRSLEEAQKHGPDEPRILLHARGTDQSASVTYTAYAPASMNNGSCIDKLEDISPDELQRSAVSYLAIGWYRDPDRHDPIVKQKIAGRADDDIRRALGLESETGSIAPPLGNRCIFHGMVTHIDYWNGRSHLGPAFGSPGSEPVHHCVGTFRHDPQKIGFGATTEEALSALLADVSPEDDGDQKLSSDFFQLLNAILHDRLDAWNTVGTEDVMRHAQQKSTFYSIAGGSEWMIGPSETPNASTSARENVKVHDDQRSMLKHLNGVQSRADVASAEFTSAAETLYTAWWQALRARGRRKVALEQATNRQAEITKAFREEMERLSPIIQAARDALQTSLNTTVGKGVAELKNFPTNSFFLAKEPAIAIRNVGANIPPFPETTIARLLDETAKERAQGDYERLTRAPIRAAMRTYVDTDLALVFDALAEEAALVEEAITSLICDRARTDAFDNDSHVDEWEDRNRRVRRCEGEIEFSTTNGRRIALSNLGTAWCRQPWVPLFLDWEVEWFPSGDSNDTLHGTLLSGRTILASRPQSMIRSRLACMGKMNTKVATMLTSCRHLLEDVVEWDVLAQSLSGLHQQLLLRDDLLPRVLPADEPLRSLVDHTSLAPPNLSPSLAFDSLRRGSVKVSRLWVVDAFGQAFSLDPSVESATKASGNGHAIPLDLRLLEPSRLSVEFAFASDEKAPIRGWLLSSLADKSLIVYDSHGSPLGMVSRIAGSGEPRGTSWHPVLANSPQTPDDIVDPVLATFVQPLVGDANALLRFNATLQHIDDALARTIPPQSMTATSTASMLGRPLVLVQARVRIERRGSPIVEPAVPTGPSAAPSTIASVNIPIWIGARSLPDDGVIGFQYDDAFKPLERTAKLGLGPPTGPPSFTIEMPGSSESATLTLLMDPRGKIYLESEILPVFALRLPEEWINDVAQNLPAVLRVAPALLHSHALLRSILITSDDSPRASIDLPLPVGAASSTENDAQAILFAGRGIDVPVKRISTGVVVPERQVAAIEGILVI